MAKKTFLKLDIRIDGLTNSIRNVLSGESLETDVLKVNKSDLKPVTKVNAWKFDWKSELKQTDRVVYKLTLQNQPDIIQGLASISDYNDHYYLHLVESAPFNLGKNKLYEGVPGNLFAFTCKSAWDKGYDGIVAFQSKTRLITHYENMLGATHVGGHKMIIFPHEALKLIKQYFKT
jgi:hypothetical protein